MAEMSTEGGGGHKKKGNKPQPKKKSTRVDFTPMVDLGFLLITFFMLTTTMSKPSAMEITVPAKIKDKEIEETKIPPTAAMTVILSENDKIYYYFGFPDTVPDFMVTDYSEQGIRKILLEKNAPQIIKVEKLKEQRKSNQINDSIFKTEVSKVFEDKFALTVLVKLDDKATYKNLVDMMDELQICSVSKQALVDVQDVELAKIQLMNQKPE
jgi:biopolymer transport protein ExbD